MFRTANWIGGALIVSQLAAFLVANAYAFLLYFLGHLTSTGASNHFIDDEMSYVLFSILMFVPFFVLCVSINHRRLSEVVPFEKHSKLLGFALVLMCLGFFLAGNIFSNLIYTALDWIGHPPYQPQSFQPNTLFELGAVLLSSACIPALTEEFAFRGVVLGLLMTVWKSLGDRGVGRPVCPNAWQFRADSLCADMRLGPGLRHGADEFPLARDRRPLYQ